MIRATAFSRNTVLFAALIGAAFWLFWPVVTNAIDNWASVEELNFGFLVPPVLVALVWWRRRVWGAESVASDRPTGADRASATGGLCLLAVGVAGFLIAERLEARSPAAAMAGLALWGGVVYLWGWQIARDEALPIAVLTFALSLQQTLISPLAFWLQGITANAAHAGAEAIGLKVAQDGLLLRGDHYSFIVADTCSGMNSLLALLTLTGLMLYVVRGPILSRAGVLVSVLPLVMLANTVRVVMVLWVADRFDQDTALGFFHGASSLLLFGVALSGLLLVTRLLRCRLIVEH